MPFKTKEKRRSEKPFLIGLDHNNPKLSGQATRLIERHGKPGNTLFVEGSKIMLEFRRKPDPFQLAIQIAEKLGMTVVPLDRELIGGIRKKMDAVAEPDGSIYLKKAGLNELEFRYLMHNVRVRDWIKKIQASCRPGDIVLMHQDHLKDVVPELQQRRFRFSYFFASRPRHPNPWTPLSKNEIREMKQTRNKKRPINYKRK